MSDHFINLSLSGKDISLKIPAKFSKDFPPPTKFKHVINIYDPDNYDSEYNNINVQSVWWDYGRRSFFFGGVNGTLHLNISIYKTDKKLHSMKNLEKIIKNDFARNHKDFDYNISQISPPENFNILTINNKEITNYTSISGGSNVSTYAIPIDEQHYITFSYSYIKNSGNKKWIEKANNTEKKIIHSLSFD